MLKLALFCGAIALSSAASAQDAADNFVGPVIGVEAGLAQHRYSVNVSITGSPDQTFRRKSDGVGGTAFAGYDVKIGSNVIFGAEAALHAGGKTSSIIIVPNTFTALRINPKLGYSLTGRIGYATSDKFLLFGRAGYGGQKYGLSGVNNLRASETNNSFVLGAGAEFRIGGKVAARLDFRHLDASRNEVLVGVLTRF
jgi:outer membrane immunogenic protein